jgi:hypothetical protein
METECSWDGVCCPPEASTETRWWTGTASVGHQKHIQKPDGGHGNGDMTVETETRYPTEVQQSQQCYPDSDRLLESDLRASVASFARQ